MWLKQICSLILSEVLSSIYTSTFVALSTSTERHLCQLSWDGMQCSMLQLGMTEVMIPSQSSESPGSCMVNSCGSIRFPAGRQRELKELFICLKTWSTLISFSPYTMGIQLSKIYRRHVTTWGWSESRSGISQLKRKFTFISSGSFNWWSFWTISSKFKIRCGF